MSRRDQEGVPQGWPPERGPIPVQFRRNKRVERIMLALLLAALTLTVASTLFYSVQADSEGVVLRFGKYQATVGPGLHWKLPWPIDTVHHVQVERTTTLEFGFSTQSPGRRTIYGSPSLGELDMARMLSGDLNMAHVEWIVHYKIGDPFKYVFQVADESNTDPGAAVADLIRDVSESAMRSLVGDRSIDEVITTGRGAIEEEARREIQKMLEKFKVGIEIRRVELQAVSPPEEVKPAFDEVNRARQQREQKVNNAHEERNRLVPAARGQKDRIISEAEGYKERVVQEMRGRSNAFLSQLAEYQKAPDVTRTRLYLETIEKVMSGVEDQVIIDESVRGLLPMMNVDGARAGGQP